MIKLCSMPSKPERRWDRPVNIWQYVVLRAMTVLWTMGLSTLLLEKGYTVEAMFKFNLEDEWKLALGIPWWSSGEDSIISLPRAQIQSLVGELRSHKLCGMGEKNLKNWLCSTRKEWKLGPLCLLLCVVPSVFPEVVVLRHNLWRKVKLDTFLQPAERPPWRGSPPKCHQGQTTSPPLAALLKHWAFTNSSKRCSNIVANN